MWILEVSIKNFKGINLDLKNLAKNILIFGKNDSRKSTFCLAIKKVLDYNERKKQLTEDDSTNNNREPIRISIVLKIDSNLDNELYSKICKYTYSENDQKLLKIILIANFNENAGCYEEEIIFDAYDSFSFSSNKWLAIDDVLDIIYFVPNYDLENEKKNFFYYHKTRQNEEQKYRLSNGVSELIKNFNNAIENDSYINSISESIESSRIFQNIFDDVDFKILSNIDHKNIFKSLDVIPFKNNNLITNIGDGKNKILSLMLRSQSYKPEKMKIFILEEPENHLYMHHQKQIIQKIKEISNNSQIICTTHSPYVVDFSKLDILIKFSCKDVFCCTLFSLVAENKLDKIGHLFNTELAEMLFYQKVVLIEGYSEKCFYNFLSIKDEEFRNKIISNQIGILSVYGIAFEKAKKILEKFNIDVFILTDNDLLYKENEQKKFDYFGIRRCIKYLTNQDQFKKEFCYFYDENFNLENKINDSDMEKIINFFEKNKIYLPNHHEGFERDYVNFLLLKNKEQENNLMNHLKKFKLINLYNNIEENLEKLEINEQNKNNRLVRFIYEK